MMDWLPLGHLNLLRNPFGELSREDRIRATILDVDGWVESLRSSRCALQFMGDCGRGKTTHLLALLGHFPEAKYVYLAEGEPMPQIPQGAPLFIDEAQRLPWVTRRRLFRRGVAMVLGTHVDLRRPLQKYGFRVQTIQVAASLDNDRLEAIFNRRIELARLRAGPIPRIRSSDVDSLVKKFGNDVRAMENYLYDQFDELKGKPGGELRIVDRTG